MLGSDWDRHSGRDKSYSDETDSPRKRTLPTPHQANPRCCKTAPTPPVGHILTNPLGCGSSGKNGHQQGCPLWSRTTKHADCSSTDQGGAKRRVGIEKSPNRLAAGASWGEGGLIPLQKAAWATFVNIWYRNGGGISAFCDLRRQTTAAGSGGREGRRFVENTKSVTNSHRTPDVAFGL